MPEFITDMSPDEIDKLPILVEIIDSNKRTYFFIKDKEGYRRDYTETPISRAYPSIKHMRQLVEKYGEEVPKEKFEDGRIYIGTSKQCGNVGYIEYRFEMPKES